MAKLLSATCIYASSEDENFPASELTRQAGSHGRQRGWQSAKFSEYPQELGFRLDGEAALTQLQLLGHQSKTPTRVDVFVSSLAENGHGTHNPPPYHQARWKRLGYLTFSNNEGSKYKSRERKTVPLDHGAYYIKLVLHKNHQNAVNVYNQVGLISISISGELHFPVQHAVSDSGLVLPPVRPAHAHQQAMDPSPRQPHITSDAHHHQPVPYDDDNVYSMVAPPAALPMKKPQKGALPPIKPRDHASQARSPNSYPTPSGNTPKPPVQQQQQYHENTYSGGPPYNTNNNDDHNAYHQPASDPVYQNYTGQDPYVQPANPQRAGNNNNEGSLGGLINYRSQRILEFETFYLAKARDLSFVKQQAIQTEDFDAAKAAKEQLVYLQGTADRIYELEQTKIRCIYDEDFEGANAAKLEMDALCNQSVEALTKVAQTGMPIADALRESGTGAPMPRNRGRPKPSSLEPSKVQSSGMSGGMSHSNSPGANPYNPTASDEPRRHVFEDQPVQSKYAQMMAEQERAKKKQNSAAVDDEDEPEHSDAPEHNNRRRRSSHHNDDDDHQDDEEDHHPHEGDDDDNNNNNVEEEEEEEEQEEDEGSQADDEDDEDEDAAPKKKPSPKKKSPRRHGTESKEHSPDTSEHPTLNESQEPRFDVEQFEEWERDVYFAIQDETGKENPEPPAEPLSRSEPISVDIQSSLGEYTTACLFSKRWKLRDAALKVISQFMSLYYTKHSTSLQVINAVLKYVDMKGFGLLDPIQQVFLSACDFVAKVIDSHFDGASFSSCQAGIVHLIPRFVLRAGDPTQKTREEALTLIFAVAGSPVGPDRVAMAMLAEPVDHDKRRMNSVPARMHVARLMVMQHLMNTHGLGRSMGVDGLMTRLLVPCLNHGNSDVRDLAVVVVGCIDDSKANDIMKHLPQVKNPNTRAVIEEKLAHPVSDNEQLSSGPTPEPTENKKKKKKRKE